MSTALTGGRPSLRKKGCGSSPSRSGWDESCLRGRGGETLVAYAFLCLPVGFYAVFMILPWVQSIVLSFFNLAPPRVHNRDASPVLWLVP